MKRPKTLLLAQLAVLQYECRMASVACSKLNRELDRISARLSSIMEWIGTDKPNKK